MWLIHPLVVIPVVEGENAAGARTTSQIRTALSHELVCNIIILFIVRQRECCQSQFVLFSALIARKERTTH